MLIIIFSFISFVKLYIGLIFDVNKTENDISWMQHINISFEFYRISFRIIIKFIKFIIVKIIFTVKIQIFIVTDVNWTLTVL